jgi:hypothetical protein
LGARVAMIPTVTSTASIAEHSARRVAPGFLAATREPTPSP